MAKLDVNVRAEFSPNGDYLACSDSTGTLQIWEASTGTKKQQYVPESHLSATCSCISWAPKRRTVTDQESPSKKKKRRSDVEKSVDELELIAVGTERGTILLYSQTKNALHTELSDGHTSRVTDVVWNQSDDSLYSCSTDGHIVDWSLVKSRRKHKWKADDSPVFSMCLCHTQRHLLSAGRIIKLWDLETREVLQTISGHQWPIFRVLQVPTSKTRRSTGGDVSVDGDASVDGSYVISADDTDRHVSIWQVNPSSGKKTIRKTITSLTLPDDAARQLAINCTRPGKLQVAALTTRGKIAVFEHVLNGPAGPLEPEHIVEISSSAEAGSLLPIRAIRFATDTESGINVAYTSENFWHPAFEKLGRERLGDAKKCRLVRTAPAPSALSVEASVSKLKKPVVSADVTVVTAAGFAPTAPARAAETEPTRERKRRRRHSQSITVEERLNAIGVADPGAGGDQSTSRDAPKTDSLATLLTQGLLSNDRVMINTVLQRRDVGVIQQTVRRLPLSTIVPLVRELSRRMAGHAQGALVTRLWLKSVMTIHASFLMTLPDRDSILGPLHQVMETRLDVLRKVCQLQGRLNLIFEQLSSKDSKAESWKKDRAQFVYKDESSDEEFAVDDTDVISEDEWEPQNDDNDDEDDDAMESDETSSSSSDNDNTANADDDSDNDDVNNVVVISSKKSTVIGNNNNRKQRVNVIANNSTDNAMDVDGGGGVNCVNSSDSDGDM